jgi:ribosome biogenesis protein MAK21
VERFLFRPGLSDRGRYYAVTFLNQIPMSNRPQEGGSALALKLVDVYFSLFKLLLEGRLGTAAARQQQQEAAAAAAAAGGKHRHSKKKGGGKQQQHKQKHQQQRRKGGGGSGDGSGDGDGSSDAAAAAAAAESVQQAGELDARMLSALITGVRRAFPYVEPDKVEPLVEAHGEALFKLVHTAPFTVALQVGYFCLYALQETCFRRGGGQVVCYSSWCTQHPSQSHCR